MRVLMSTQPSLGHVHPCLGVARALRDAGHEVRLATAPGMAPSVRAAGITPVSIGADIRHGVHDPSVDSGDCSLAGDGLRRWVAGLYEHAVAWTPDVLVRDWFEGAGLVVAERMRIPSAVLGIMVPPAPDHLRGLLGEVLDFEPPLVRSAAADLERVYGDLLLPLYPPSLAPPDEPPIGRRLHIQPPLYDGAESVPAPEWLGELGDAPLVFVSLGTWHNRAPGLFEAVLEAAAAVDARIVIALGRDREPGEFEPVPANIRLERWVPQARLIPRCAVVICQGFITRMAALTHGVPVGAIAPGYGVSRDSRRIEELGAGLSYPIADENAAGPMDSGGLDPAVLHSMMATLLADTSYRQGAQRIRTEIAALPDIRHAVDAIESIASSRAGARGGTRND